MASAAAVLLWCGLSAGNLLASAEPALPASSSVAPAAERTRVALLVDGNLAPDRRAALERVLRTELEPHGVMLVVETTASSSPPRLAWVRGVEADPQTLVAAVLEVSASGAELYVVDAARGRAIVRRLPSGAGEDLALPEAVASILESAVLALREGLEVASEPVETVVGEPAPFAPPKTVAAVEEPDSPPSEPSAFRVAGGVGVNVATLGDDVVVGGNVNALVRWTPHFATRLGAALFAPDRVTTDYGDFRLRRSAFDLRLAWLLPARPWTVMPEVGASLELVQRTDATAEAAATASPDTSHLRFGGLLGLRATVPLSSLVAFDAGVHADYYTRGVDFVAGGATPTTIFSLGRFATGVDLGLLFGGF